MDLGKLIGESLVVGSTRRGLGINGLWADTAIRLGYLSKDVATVYLRISRRMKNIWSLPMRW